MGAANSAGSPEQPGGSDDAQLLLAFGQFVLAYGNHFRRMMKREIEAMMRTKEFQVLLIQNFHTAIVPIVEDLFRKTAKEEIQSAIKNFLADGNWTNANTVAVKNGRRLHFLDDVSEDVLTGKEIKGKGGTPIRVALVDEVTKQVIKSGPESSAKVEILLLEASEHENEHNWSHQDFNSRIIKEHDKTKPHFPKSYYVYLKGGIGELSNAKLAHDSNWMKNCRCRLGARVIENLSGIRVLEAWSKSFEVSDSRSKLYVKHGLPSLSDPVWRLVHIGRNGEPCKRLNNIKVWTVQDFLFFHSVDPQRLQKIIGAGANAWKAIVDHAQSSIITDKRIGVYNDSAEHNMSVVFDVAGGLKGVIHDSQYVLISHLSKSGKDHAHKLLRSAFENQKGIHYFSDEKTLAEQFPYQGSFTSMSTSILENFHGCNPAIPEDDNHCDPTETGTSSLRISPSIEPSNANDPLMHQVPDRTIYAARNTQEGFPGCNSSIPKNTNHNDPKCGTLSQSVSPSIGPWGITGFDTLALSMDFDIYEGLKGVIHDSQNALFGHQLEAEKDHAYKVLCSAHENRTGINFHSNESALMCQVPHHANYAATNASIQEGSPGCNPTIPVNISHYNPTEQGTSSQRISPAIRPSDNANNTHIHQVQYQTSYTAMNAPIQEGFHGHCLTIPDNANHCDQTEPGTPSQIISPTGASGNSNNTLVKQVPYGTSYTATKTSIQEGLPSCDQTIPVSINHCESTEPGTSSQGVSPSICTLGLPEMQVSKRRKI